MFWGRLLVPRLWENPSVIMWLPNNPSWFSHPKLLLTEHSARSARMDVFYTRDIQCGCHSPRVDAEEDLQCSWRHKELRVSILFQLNSVQTEVVTYGHNTEQHSSKTPTAFGFQSSPFKNRKLRLRSLSHKSVYFTSPVSSGEGVYHGPTLVQKILPVGSIMNILIQIEHFNIARVSWREKI